MEGGGVGGYRDAVPHKRKDALLIRWPLPPPICLLHCCAGDVLRHQMVKPNSPVPGVARPRQRLCVGYDRLQSENPHNIAAPTLLHMPANYNSRIATAF